MAKPIGLALLGVAVCLAVAAPVDAQAPRKDQWKALTSTLPLFDRDSVDALSGSLRGHLVRNLPPVLFEASPGWGTMKEVPNGITWRGQGFRVHPEVQHTWKNHGTWNAIRVSTGSLGDSLIFDIRDLGNTQPGQILFNVYISFDARADCNQQVWRSGIRLHSGSYRARFRAKVLMACEVTARLEANGTILPDAVFRFRVVAANVTYDNLVVEHAAGFGGTAAQLLGDAVKGSLDQWKPSLERDMLAKANAAIVKAADTKEVRVSLMKLLSKK